MARCFFASDLHGSQERYRKLFRMIERENPDALFLGGDLFPSGLGAMMGIKGPQDFFEDVIAAGFGKLRKTLRDYPAVFLILGNDDGKMEEKRIRAFERQALWTYVHNRCVPWRDYLVCGYAYVPPTPFLLKDWERYDVSNYLDPLCVAPEDGCHSVPVAKERLKLRTISEDLRQLVEGRDLSRALCLFHTPPYKTGLDRAALDGRKVDHAPLDVHIGSIAVRRFIEARQPRLTLHGHVHESARITGVWRERIGGTVAISAAHDGPALALVRFDPEEPEQATRELI
jgi:Icc-related predicted phosphoesterase